MAASTTQSARFNVREFARTARGNHRADLDLSEFQTQRLSDQTLRELAFLSDLEGATMAYLRNVLVTPTHKDARVTAFLVSWAFEKFWIADALEAVLEANEYVRPAPAGANARRRRGSLDRAARRGPIYRAISAIVLGPPVVAIHMTTELVDQWITRAAYERVDETANSQGLSSVIALVLDVKERHVEFFAQEADRRLRESDRAARLTRKSLAKASWPIGAVDRPQSDRLFFERFTFGHPQGQEQAASIERRVAALPRIGAKVAASVRERLTS